MNKKLAFLLINDNLDEQDNKEYIQMKKKEKGNIKLEKYEKFKPKENPSKKKDPELKGAENKVKSLLSSFLRNIESEEKIDKESNSGLLNIIESTKKLNLLGKTEQNTSNRFNRRKSNNFSINKKGDIISTSNNNNINYMRANSVQINIGGGKNGRGRSGGVPLESQQIHFQDRVIRTKKNEKKNAIDKPKKRNKKSLNNNNNLENLSKSPTNPLKDIKRTKSTSVNRQIFTSKKKDIKEHKHINKTKSMKIENELKFAKRNSNASKIDESKIINKDSIINDSKTLLLQKRTEIKKDESYKGSSLLSFDLSLINAVNNNNNNNSNNNSNNNNNNNNLKITNSNIKWSINLSKNDASSIISKKSFINDSNIINSNIKSSIVKKDYNTNNNNLNNLNLISSKRRQSLKKIEYKRAITSSPPSCFKHLGSNNKNTKAENTLKNLQEQIKKTIILRPEDLDISLGEETLNKNNNRRLKRNKTVCKKSTITSNINNNNLNVNTNNKTNNNIQKKSISSVKLEKIIKMKSTDNIVRNINIKTENKDNTFLKLQSEGDIEKKSITTNIINNNNNSSSFSSGKKNSQKNILSSLKNPLLKEQEKKTTKIVAGGEDEEGEAEENIKNISTTKKDLIIHEKYRIITHKGLLYDSLDDEEFEDEVTNYLYISPNSRIIIIFDGVLFCLSVYSLLSIPLYLSKTLMFCKERKFSFTSYITFFNELMYIIDFFLGFFRAYYNFEEQLIHKNTSIIINYLNSWCLIDLFSAIPFYTLLKLKENYCNDFDLSTSYYNTILNNLNYLLICNKTLKILKVISCNQAYSIISNKINNSQHASVFFSSIIRIIAIISVLHFCSCLYIFIGRNSYPNWILYTKLETKGFSDIYICSIYILITAITTVGYGDITCYSFTERIFQIFLLIIGIMAYSWTISSFSNLIKKINERSADFESKKKILDDIRLNNPNIPDELYERVLRHLKYKKIHEKQNKSIIFDCLPVGLKNNLIAEMYKPIIKNFIFFKNFQNIDFIVRVVMSFRPVLAIKNDILVNEGDIVEDIMFVKKGVLSVELPINMKDPQENIDKYFNMTILKIEKGPGLEKLGNTTTVVSGGGINLNKIMQNNTNNNDENYNQNKYSKKDTFFQDKNHISYVKILNIRENEHFGDVLMFLEKRSPLRVRVRSKKSELFFLKKMDAVNISSSYQNIWRRINKKSVFNFEQIKKSIRKIIELYCSIKRTKSIMSTPPSSKRNKEPPKAKAKRNSMIISKNNHKYCLEKIKQATKRNNSQKDMRKSIHLFNNYFPFNANEKSEIDDLTNNITNINKYHTHKIIFNQHSMKSSEDSDEDSDSDDSSDSDQKIAEESKKKKSSKKNNIDTKLMNAYNRNYKFYKGVNDGLNQKTERFGSIITEEPGYEDTLISFKKTASINKGGGGLNRVPSLNVFMKNKSLKKSMNINNTNNNKITQYTQNDLSINEVCINEKDEYEYEEEEKKRQKKKVKKTNSKKQIIVNTCSDSKPNSEKTVKYEISRSLVSSELPPLFSYKESNKDSSSSNMSLASPFKKVEINKELYPGEGNNFVHFANGYNKEEDLLCKKMNLKEIWVNNINESYFEKFLINDESKIIKMLGNNKSNNRNEDTDKNSNNKSNDNKNIINNKEENCEKENNNNKNDINNLINNGERDEQIDDKNKNNINNKNCCCLCHCVINNNMNNINNKTIQKYPLIISNSEIKLEYKSSYQNINVLSNYKYISNKPLQQKIKNCLNETQIHITFSSRSNSISSKYHKTNLTINPTSFEKNNSLTSKNSKFNYSTIKPNLPSKNFSFFKACNSFGLNKDKSPKKKSNKRNSISIIKEEGLDKRSETLNERQQSKINRSTSIELIKKKRYKFGTNIGNFNVNKLKIIATKSRRKNSDTNTISKNFSVKDNGNNNGGNNNGNNNEGGGGKKRRGTLLSQINLNIQKTNQKLNNPEEFYSSYFNSLLGAEKKFNRKTQRRGSAICFAPKIGALNSLKSQKEKDKNL